MKVRRGRRSSRMITAETATDLKQYAEIVVEQTADDDDDDGRRCRG